MLTAQHCSYREALLGYEVNDQFPNLTVSIGNGIHQLVKCIKMLDNCTVSVFTTDDSPGSTPDIFHVYAQPTVGAELVGPLPPWFEELIIGPMLAYHALYEGAWELEDWGISADITRV